MHESAIIIFTVYLYTLVVSGLPQAIITELMATAGEGVGRWGVGETQEELGGGVYKYSMRGTNPGNREVSYSVTLTLYRTQ
jgi:hypothetical protein